MIDRVKFKDTIQNFINELKKDLKNKSLNKFEKSIIKKNLITSKKHQIENNKMITILKRLINK